MSGLPFLRPAAGLLLAAAALGSSGCGRPAEPPAPASAPAPAVPHSPAPPKSKVFPASAAPLLDDPGRDEWQKPEAVIAALALRPGHRVADVGCGTGYFTLRLLRAEAKPAVVVAVDIQQEMLDLLAKRLAPGEKERVILRRNAPDRPLEAADALDLVLCANTLNEVEDADAERFVKSMAAGLAPGGRLALINWLPGKTRLGPPPEARISPARVRELAEGAGLTLAEDLDFLPMHSFLVFRKPK